jgi:pimeloyl-ACP methyl ester carboxylesterase
MPSATPSDHQVNCVTLPLPVLRPHGNDTSPAEVNDIHTVVILHGWQKNLEVVRPLGELLASSRVRIVLIDLPGFGRSPLPQAASNEGGGWDTAQYAEVVRNVLLGMGVSRCTLVGHSFGGRISVRLASKYPELVSALVLIASHGIPRDRKPLEAARISWIRLLTRVAKGIDATLGTRIFSTYLAPRFGSADYKAAGDLRKTMVKTVNENLSHEARRVSQPTLLLWGEDDTETPPDIGRKFRSAIQNSTLHILPNKGHEPYSDVGAHLLASYIENFIYTTVLGKEQRDDAR